MQDIPWALIAPVLVVQLVLAVVALRDLWGRGPPRDTRWIWTVVIVIGGFIGPVAYFVFGRNDD